MELSFTQVPTSKRERHTCTLFSNQSPNPVYSSFSILFNLCPYLHPLCHSLSSPQITGEPLSDRLALHLLSVIYSYPAAGVAHSLDHALSQRFQNETDQPSPASPPSMAFLGDLAPTPLVNFKSSIPPLSCTHAFAYLCAFNWLSPGIPQPTTALLTWLTPTPP